MKQADDVKTLDMIDQYMSGIDLDEVEAVHGRRPLTAAERKRAQRRRDRTAGRQAHLMTVTGLLERLAQCIRERDKPNGELLLEELRMRLSGVTVTRPTGIKYWNRRTGESWTGKGQMPAWVRQYMERGRFLSELEE